MASRTVKNFTTVVQSRSHREIKLAIYSITTEEAVQQFPLSFLGTLRTLMYVTSHSLFDGFLTVASKREREREAKSSDS